MGKVLVKNKEKRIPWGEKKKISIQTFTLHLPFIFCLSNMVSFPIIHPTSYTSPDRRKLKEKKKSHALEEMVGQPLISVSSK